MPARCRTTGPTSWPTTARAKTGPDPFLFVEPMSEHSHTTGGSGMSRRARWTLAIVSIALFMTTLDNLVVSTALPSIRASLGASIESLEWTVNAYTLSFAVLLLTGAALGDRFGRRRMFLIGVGAFTVSSA